MLEDRAGAVEGGVHDRPHRAVDLPRGLLRVAPRLEGAARAAQQSAAILRVGGVSEFGHHGVLRHHAARDVRGARQVVGRAGRELPEHDLLRDAAPEQHGQLLLQLPRVIR